MKIATLANLRKFLSDLREQDLRQIIEMINNSGSVTNNIGSKIVYVNTYADLSGEEPDTDAIYVVVDSQEAYRCVEHIDESDNISYSFELVIGFEFDDNIVCVGDFDVLSSKLERYTDDTKGWNVLQADLTDAAHPESYGYSFYVISQGSGGKQVLSRDFTTWSRVWERDAVSGKETFSEWDVVTLQKELHAGRNIEIENGDTVHALGYTYDAAKKSFATGRDTIASGYESIAEGYHSVASGNWSHAEGFSEASAELSHAEGKGTAKGNTSHAEGKGIANGGVSHAEGYDTIANGTYSHAEGYGTIASGDHQHVSGRYNIEDTNGEYAEIVGGGSAHSTATGGAIRKNIRTLDWNGIESVNGVKALDSDKRSDSKFFATDGTIQEISDHTPVIPTYAGGTGIDIIDNNAAGTDRTIELLHNDNLTVNSNNELSAVDTKYVSGSRNVHISAHDLDDENNPVFAISVDEPEQTEYIGGQNVQIVDNHNGTKTINATDTVYSAGDNIEIDSNNRISAIVPEMTDVDALHYGENNFAEHDSRDVIINGDLTDEQGQNDLRITSRRAELKMTSNKPTKDEYDEGNNHIVERQESVSQLTHDKILFEKTTLHSVNEESESAVKHTSYKQTQQDIQLEASGQVKIATDGSTSINAGGQVKIGSGGNSDVLRVNGDKVQTPNANEVSFQNAFKVSRIQSSDAKIAAKVTEFDIKGTDDTRYFKTSGQGTTINTRLDVEEPDKQNQLRLKSDGFEVNIHNSEHTKLNRIKMTAGGDVHITHEDEYGNAGGIEIVGSSGAASEHHVHVAANRGITIGVQKMENAPKDEYGNMRIQANPNTAIAIGYTSDESGIIKADSEASIARGFADNGELSAEGSVSSVTGIVTGDAENASIITTDWVSSASGIVEERNGRIEAGNACSIAHGKIDYNGCGNYDYITAGGSCSIAHGRILGDDSEQSYIEAVADGSIASGIVRRNDGDYIQDAEFSSVMRISAVGDSSVACGDTEYGSVQSEQLGAVAIGSGVKASGEFASARGIFAFAYGKASEAQGIGVKAWEKGAHAEGYGMLFSHPIILLPNGRNGRLGIQLKDYKEAREVWFLKNKPNVEWYLHFESISGLGGRHHLLNRDTFTLYAESTPYTESDYWYYRDSKTASNVNFYIDFDIQDDLHIGDKPEVMVRNVAAQQASHAEGKNTIANEKNSHAEGLVNIADGQNSHVEGHLNLTTAENSHAEGYRNIAGGKQAHAEGANNFALGENSHVSGESSYALGKDAHAEGRSLFATGHASHAEGRGKQFDAINAGYFEIRWSEDDTYWDSDDEKEYDGAWFNVGPNSIYFNKRQVIIDKHNYRRVGIVRHVDTDTEKIFVSSVGVDSFGEDSYDIYLCSGAFGDYSHVEGRSTISSGQDAHAEGFQTIARGNHSHAEGDECIANAIGSHAEGVLTVAEGRYSHAEGWQTIAKGDYSHVGGKYNVEDANGEFAEIVGGGANDDDRVNIRTLDWNGVESVNGMKALNGAQQANNKFFATDGTIQQIPTPASPVEYSGGQGVQIDNTNKISHNLVAGNNIQISDNLDGTTEIAVVDIQAISNTDIDNICTFN